MEEPGMVSKVTTDTRRVPTSVQLRHSVDDFFASDRPDLQPVFSGRPDLELFGARPSRHSYMRDGSPSSRPPSPEHQLNTADPRSKNASHRFDAEEERSSSAFQVLSSPHPFHLKSNVDHSLVPEEDERMDAAFIRNGKWRQSQGAKTHIHFEERLGPQPNIERVRYGFDTTKRATTTAEHVSLSMPVPSSLWLDEMGAVSEQKIGSSPTPACRIPLASQNVSRVTDYPRQVASPMMEFTSPFTRQTLRGARPFSFDHYLPSSSPASQPWNIMPGRPTYIGSRSSPCCWAPPVDKRVPYNGLPSIEDSYQRIFERSKAGSMGEDPFSRYHEQIQRRTTPESITALTLGSEVEDQHEEVSPPSLKRMRLDEQAPASQFERNSIQEVGSIQSSQQVLGTQPLPFSGDPEERNAWVRRNVAPHYVSSFTKPVVASCDYLDRPVVHSNTFEAYTPQYVYPPTQYHSAPAPTYPDHFSQCAYSPARDHYSTALPHDMSDTSCNPMLYSYPPSYASWRFGTDMTAVSRPVGAHESTQSWGPQFVMTREMEEVAKSQAAVMAAACNASYQSEPDRESDDMADGSCSCVEDCADCDVVEDSADEYFDPEVDGEGAAMSVEFVDGGSEDVESAAEDEQFGHKEIERSGEEAEQNSELLTSDENSDQEKAGPSNELLNSEKGTESEDGNYTSGFNSNSGLEYSNMEDSESNGQGSDLEYSEDDNHAPTAGSFDGSNPDSDNEDMDSNASTATLQHEIPEIFEGLDGNGVESIRKIVDEVRAAEMRYLPARQYQNLRAQLPFSTDSSEVHGSATSGFAHGIFGQPQREQQRTMTNAAKQARGPGPKLHDAVITRTERFTEHFRRQRDQTSVAQSPSVSSRASPSLNPTKTPNIANFHAALDGFRDTIPKATDAIDEAVAWIKDNSRYKEGKTAQQMDDFNTVSVPAALPDGRKIEKRRMGEKEPAVWPAADALKTSIAKYLNELPTTNKVHAKCAEKRQRHFQHMLEGIDAFWKSVMASSLSREHIDKQLMEARKIHNKARRVVKTPGVRRHAPAFWEETMATLHVAVGFWQAQQTLRKHDSGTAAVQTPRTRESSVSEDESPVPGRERKADDLIGSGLTKERAAVGQSNTVDNRSQPKHYLATKRKADYALEARGTKRRQSVSNFGLKSDCESEVVCDSSSSSLASKIWKERLEAPRAGLARFREARAAAPPEPPASQSCTSGMGLNGITFDRPWSTIPRPRAEEMQCLGVKARVSPQEYVRPRTEISLNQNQEYESSATHASLSRTNIVVSDEQSFDSDSDYDPDFEAESDPADESDDFNFDIESKYHSNAKDLIEATISSMNDVNVHDTETERRQTTMRNSLAIGISGIISGNGDEEDDEEAEYPGFGVFAGTPKAKELTSKSSKSEESSSRPYTFADSDRPADKSAEFSSLRGFRRHNLPHTIKWITEA